MTKFVRPKSFCVSTQCFASICPLTPRPATNFRKAFSRKERASRGTLKHRLAAFSISGGAGVAFVPARQKMASCISLTREPTMGSFQAYQHRQPGYTTGLRLRVELLTLLRPVLDGLRSSRRDVESCTATLEEMRWICSASATNIRRPKLVLSAHDAPLKPTGNCRRHVGTVESLVGGGVRQKAPRLATTTFRALNLKKHGGMSIPCQVARRKSPGTWEWWACLTESKATGDQASGVGGHWTQKHRIHSSLISVLTRAKFRTH